MYLKKTKGPRTIILPDGATMTRADLPDADCRLWVASRKAAVVRAVVHGLIGFDQACKTYDLSEEELQSWSNAVARHGEKALKATRLQKFRQL